PPSPEYALALSERRAQSLRSYLIRRGVPAQRISTIARGSGKPLITADNPEERVNRTVRQMNSRAEIYISPR
ncbi:OmpA family protein, partial [bacterium]|nr:OmpA family protein [bacterium]